MKCEWYNWAAIGTWISNTSFSVVIKETGPLKITSFDQTWLLRAIA